MESASHVHVETLRRLWKFSRVAAAEVRPDGTFRSVNPRFCQLVGYTESELQARDFQSITHRDDLDTDVEMTSRVLRGDLDQYTMLKRYITKDDKVLGIILHVSAVLTEDGKRDLLLAQAEPIEANSDSVMPTIETTLASLIKRNWKQITAGLGTLIGGLTTVGIYIQNRFASFDTIIEQQSQTIELLKELINK